MNTQLPPEQSRSTARTTWDIDPLHASAEFEVRHLGIALVAGRFAGVRGTIEVDPARPQEGRVEATIDAASVDTGVPDRDDDLRSPNFFDVDRFPEMRFVSRRVEVEGPDEGRVVGELTLRGVTREVPLRVERTGEGDDGQGGRRTGVRAEATLSLKDFGLAWSQPLPGGQVSIGDKVRVVLRLEAVRRAAPAR